MECSTSRGHLWVMSGLVPLTLHHQPTELNIDALTAATPCSWCSMHLSMQRPPQTLASAPGWCSG